MLLVIDLEMGMFYAFAAVVLAPTEEQGDAWTCGSHLDITREQPKTTPMTSEWEGDTVGPY